MAYEMAWLSYRKKEGYEDRTYFRRIYISGQSRVLRTAADELCYAAKELLQVDPVVIFEEEKEKKDGGIWLCQTPEGPEDGGYFIYEKSGLIHIEAAKPEGLLYGSFALIRTVQREKPLKKIVLKEIPKQPLRMLNHWDNLDGSIERGYSGDSFFFEKGKILINDRIKDYARLAASVGINGVVINNVNVGREAAELITEKHSKELRQLGEIFGKYGLSLYLSIDFAAPFSLGELETADPEKEEVRQWWERTMERLFCNTPGLAGFLVKADSEGRPGPFTYGRSPAQGANMLARAVKPYGGVIIWRCFVYNCTQDWRDRKTDRARAAYDHFAALDGEFEGNVILQIKNGPMDFQVREPVNSLFGTLRKTNQMLEFQIAQEYTGQQRHVCYLIPQFKEILDFHTFCKEEKDTVADIVGGKAFGQTNCGMAAVANTGSDENWTGHDLAAANWFGFGRLAFNNTLLAEEIAEEWCECTFGVQKDVSDIVCRILMMSWPAYEKYTSPLGIGWMVQPGTHYGPNVDGYEYERWGTYHRADHKGIGVERGKGGTGYAQTYLEPNASMYDSIRECPEELLLFFHYIPYSHRMKNGKTLIQHIYDSHFEGVEDVERMLSLWKETAGKIPEEIYRRVRRRLEHQLEHSKEWRDQINTYFYRKSWIEDEKHRKINL